jgi:predicted transglutaminase-like cysteine proteinase
MSRIVLGAASAMVVTVLGVFSAQAQVPEMPMGMRTAAPEGFAEFCRRQPQECAGMTSQTPSQTVAAVLPVAATTQPAPQRPAPAWTPPTPRRNWRLVPTNSIGSTDASAPPTSAKAKPTPAAVVHTDAKAAAQADRLAAKAALLRTLKAKRDASKRLDPRRWSRAPMPSGPRLSAPMPYSPAPHTPRAAAPVTLDLLTRVNRTVNRRIARAPDGRQDVWTLPTGDRPSGDCEDYVLAKRQALIQAGVSPDALSIAVVLTRGGDGHAVLLARTDQGEYVLDNLSPWVVRWAEAPYQWISRQSAAPGRPWVQIGGPPQPLAAGGRPIVITLAAG